MNWVKWLFGLFLFMQMAVMAATAAEGVELWCAAGLCKTGNTFLRPVLHALHDPLKAQGVLVVRSNLHSGGNALYSHLKADPLWLEKRLNHAKETKCHTVLLYSENLFLNLDPGTFVKKAQSLFFRVHVSFCVRDFYPLLYTLYQEYRKADRIFASWPNWAATGDYRGVKEISYFLKSDVPLTLINYDVHKGTLLQSLFREVGIAIDWDKIEVPDMPRRNRSVALPEWNIMEVFRRARVRISKPWECRFWRAVEKAFPDRRPFRYYNAEADENLYRRHGELIILINSRLPEGQKIPTEPHMPLDYTTEWDQAHTTVEDVQYLVRILKLGGLYSEENPSYTENRAMFPDEFDAYQYVADHLEILPAEEDPYLHYLSNT